MIPVALVLYGLVEVSLVALGLLAPARPEAVVLRVTHNLQDYGPDQLVAGFRASVLTCRIGGAMALLMALAGVVNALRLIDG